jgi:hypothetical protein
MTLKLTTPLRREIEIDGETYTLLVTREGVRLAPKRFRSGRTMTWRSLWERGDEELPALGDDHGGRRGHQRGPGR